jgi:ectoine hydroxylase-related dioxygenase (phytanoyl-CoA dioxygenase family)
MLTAWVALQDCDPMMGTVSMLDGSHRWPDTEAVRAVRYGRTFLGTALATLEERLERSGMLLNPVPLSLKTGQVSFHHCMTLHGSGPNRGDRPRIGLTAHLQDGANHYQRVLDKQGNLCGHANDRACRKLADGSPDYADPAVCPVLWKE